MFTIKNRFQVFLESGKVYNVEGKLFSFGDELKLTDLDGRTLASVNQKLMSLVPRYEISVSGKPVCQVIKKVTFSNRNLKFPDSAGILPAMCGAGIFK